LAFDYRQAFQRDVVLDIVCYRRYGHNEGDDPSYTQPQMYKIIDQLRSVRKLYTETLVRRGDISIDEAEAALNEFNARLQNVLDEVRTVPVPELKGVPVAETPADRAAPDTGVDLTTLMVIARATVSAPEGFTIHPKLERQFTQRLALLESGEVDWAFGEALALGSLVVAGSNVRLTGQDTRRGTFSHRHAALIDYDNGKQYVPLASMGAPGFFTVRDSFLSEYAALGFEYGYSVEASNTLVAWEAQFGDFANGAEIIIDNFLVAAEDKWGQHATLVMLLPHGYEGQGPEHSSGRIERFLSLSARNNIRVAQPTTSAQYFHLLRSQVLREHPTPLIVFTPKSMLRAVQTRSPIAEFEHGSFQTVLDDHVSDTASITRVVLASGKVSHEALGHRDATSSDHVAVVRVEQLYPWPAAEIERVLERYPNLAEVVWLQEEPENMGAWPFVHLRMHDHLRHVRVSHVARAESASPATGSGLLHAAEQADLLARAIG
jgi:2-oxoglutarate dehydrogenase E1 component